MTAKDFLLDSCCQFGCDFAEDENDNHGQFIIYAPIGQTFQFEEGAHELREVYKWIDNQGRLHDRPASMARALIEMINYGLEECTEPDCDECLARLEDFLPVPELPEDFDGKTCLDWIASAPEHVRAIMREQGAVIYRRGLPDA